MRGVDGAEHPSGAHELTGLAGTEQPQVVVTDAEGPSLFDLFARPLQLCGISGEHDLAAGQVFSTDIQFLFSKVVTLAEKSGKHVELLVVPGTEVNDVILETAVRLKSSLIMIGVSGKMSLDALAKGFGDSWEHLPAPRPKLSLEIVQPNEDERNFINLGPHPPRLWPEDEELLHRLWLEISEQEPGQILHHRDVLRVALRRLDRDWSSDRRKEVLGEVQEPPS